MPHSPFTRLKGMQSCGLWMRNLVEPFRSVKLGEDPSGIVRDKLLSHSETPRVIAMGFSSQSVEMTLVSERRSMSGRGDRGKDAVSESAGHPRFG